ncbi:MAG: class I SAM-dependent methyltransferase [Candidatus Eisenbacteria bacterium]|nr:class I SAM-dependent methyltransferase [Candidatus Eisenbacteria bacterium]MBU1950555.1 class I SAM-dependent methyltransferase [Candidatus Eisenbacteria bacterium]
MNRESSQNGVEWADVETSSEEYARRFSGEVGKYFLDLQTQITLELLTPWPGARILDIGGGHGQLALPLVQAGYQVTVAGSRPACQMRLSRLLPDGSYDFKVGDLLSLPMENKSFDVVLSFRLLPHLESWPGLIAECCRLAAKAVIVDYPDIRSINLFSRMLFRAKKAVEKNTRPFTCFSRAELLTEFSTHHFGHPLFRPEFFIPMALHRALNSGPGSRRMESVCRQLGLTGLLGSPVILRVTPESS